MQFKGYMMINVTAAIMERDGKILIAKRSSTSSLPNKWEFPGGKVEVGETPEDCLARELYEEFDIIVTVGEFFSESVYAERRLSLGIMIVISDPMSYFAHRKSAVGGMASFHVAKDTLNVIGLDCPIWLVGVTF